MYIGVGGSYHCKMYVLTDKLMSFLFAVCVCVHTLNVLTDWKHVGIDFVKPVSPVYCKASYLALLCWLLKLLPNARLDKSILKKIY